jgi:hypothetical protein
MPILSCGSGARPHPRASSLIPASLAVVLMLSSCVGSAEGAEFVMRDMQADASVLPTAFDYTLTSPSANRTGSDHFDAGTGLELGGRYSIGRVGDPFGLVLGLDVSETTYSYDSQNFLFAYGVRGSIGAGWAFNDAFALTGEVGALVGRSRISLPSTSASPSLSASGSYHSYDIRVEGIYTITRRMLISCDLGYLSQTHDLTTGQGDSLTLVVKGIYVGIGMTWRFSNAPERVE